MELDECLISLKNCGRTLKELSPQEVVNTIQSCFKTEVALKFLTMCKDLGKYFCYGCSDNQLAHVRSCSHFSGQVEFYNIDKTVGNSSRVVRPYVTCQSKKSLNTSSVG
jgi:hypothetical protein